MKNKVTIGLIIIIVAFLVIMAIRGTSPQTPVVSNTDLATSTVTGSSPKIIDANVTINTNSKIFTMAQIAIHNTSGDCWTAINGKVYDVSNYGDKHPGGKENILKTCGVDGSQAYNKKHGDQSKPANVLDTMLIGRLSK